MIHLTCSSIMKHVDSTHTHVWFHSRVTYVASVATPQLLSFMDIST